MVSPHAAIELHAKTLRYAAFKPQGEATELERLGNFDFDFDTGEAFASDNGDGVQAVEAAARAAFGDAAPQTLDVIVHPPLAHTFFVPMPVSARSDARSRHLRQEAMLLLGASAEEGPIHVEELHAYADEVQTRDVSVNWIHALAVREQVRNRVAIIGEVLGVTPRLRVGGYGVSFLLDHYRAAQRAGEAGFLAVGWYPSHMELVYSAAKGAYFSHHIDAVEKADTGYMALAHLKKFNISERQLRQVFLYGMVTDNGVHESLKSAFGRAPVRLDALALLDVDAGDAVPSFNRQVYAPALGVAARSRSGQQGGDGRAL